MQQGMYISISSSEDRKREIESEQMGEGCEISHVETAGISQAVDQAA